MRTLRKNSLLVAAILNFIFGAFSLYVALGVIFNLQGLRDFYVQYFYEQSFNLNISANTFINYLSFFLILSFTVNVVFGIYYIKYKNLSYLNFSLKRQKIVYMLFANLLLSIINISFIFVMVAIYCKETTNEITSLNIEFYNTQKDLYYKELINTNPLLFSMSEKIKKLKQQLQNNEINEHEYINKLKEIISTGVNS